MTFFVMFRPNNRQRAKSLSLGTNNGAGQQGRVLVVEDDHSSRRALLMLLKLRGFETTHACNLAEALEQLKSRPSVVLLDLMLPDGNGSTVLDYIRRNNLPIRVAVTSGACNWESLLGDGPAKPDAFFGKPLHIERVMEWLSDRADAFSRADV